MRCITFLTIWAASNDRSAKLPGPTVESIRTALLGDELIAGERSLNPKTG
jgi:hypothetical protein